MLDDGFSDSSLVAGDYAVVPESVDTFNAKNLSGGDVVVYRAYEIEN